MATKKKAESQVPAEESDELIIRPFFHLDHCGALPYFLEKTAFKGRCFMTHASKAIFRWLLSDYVKEVEVNGIKFWCYTAGHVLGAAMFMIEIAGVKVLYTGDFSRQEDRHLMAAEIPNVHPDVVIVVRFTGLVHDIVARGGRCLIPVFALGRAQELLLILDEYWSNHPELNDIPIYYASSLAKKCMSVYQTYINAMNDRIKRQISISNPFVFKHISNLKSMEHFEDIGPSIVLASPGMMQSGLSRELFESWCTDKRNGCIIAGYCVEGTLAKHILSEPEEIVTMAGQRLPMKCSVDYISFSAHTDYKQTSEFLRALKPAHVVLVHGEANEMSRLKAALIREYEDDTEYQMLVHNPRNTVAVELHFRGEKIAKVVGSLAIDRDKQDQKVSGILRLSIAYTGTLPLLKYYLSQLSADIEQIEINDRVALRVFKSVNVIIEPKMAVIEWVANPVTDMYADSVITVVLRAETDPMPQRTVPPALVVDKGHVQECMLEMLADMFGTDGINKLIKGDKMTLR
ncbi:hypothetical protein KUTeg_022639 [Tegillarca granosa]|uniref:Beta-Casp domain-containing protein n=1 Tax=Tegillarca granosa TaxID=220873 RepID=A0ABQ9DZ63_TEGGR|nr:hypothetical protein KUTeg_022639 [Tegillarca granosa]